MVFRKYLENQSLFKLKKKNCYFPNVLLFVFGPGFGCLKTRVRSTNKYNRQHNFDHISTYCIVYGNRFECYMEWQRSNAPLTQELTT